VFLKRIRLKNCDIWVVTDDRRTLGAISIAMPSGGRVLSYDLLGSSFEYAGKVIAEWLALRTGRPCIAITNVRLGDFNLYRRAIEEMLAVAGVEEDNRRDNGR